MAGRGVGVAVVAVVILVARVLDQIRLGLPCRRMTTPKDLIADQGSKSHYSCIAQE